MKITLSEIEVSTISILSSMRTLVARCNNVKDAKMSKLNGIDIDFDGLLAEYAFCKKFNLFLDIVPSPRSGSYDCIYKGKRVDIKSTRHKNGRLITTTKKNEDVDVYVLAIIDNYDVEFIGWCYTAELYNEKNIKDLGYGNGYCLERDQLRTWKKEK